MKHSMVTMRLHKIAVIFIVIGAVLLAALLVGVGYLLGGGLKPAATVVTPAAASPKPVVTASATATTAITAPAQPAAVRVGVYDTEDEAKTLVQQLAARKLAASVVPITTSGGITLYTVEVGPYATREAAGAAAKTLAADHGLQTAVVPADAGKIKAP